jgi:hypothetical protein
VVVRVPFTAWNLKVIPFYTVALMLHIIAGDLQLIPFNTVCGGDIAHYNWGYTIYSLQHCLWW